MELPCHSRRRLFSAVVKPRLEPAGARLGECVSEATAFDVRRKKFHASAILRRHSFLMSDQGVQGVTMPG